MDIVQVVPLKSETIVNYAILFREKKLMELVDNNPIDFRLKKYFFRDFKIEESKKDKCTIIRTDMEKEGEYLLEPIFKEDFKKILDKAAFLARTIMDVS